MAVISITITSSNLQLVAGIPTFITISTNIPSTVFYTLDGSAPTTSSSIVTGSIKLPTDNNTVTLRLFATNGVDSSPIIEQLFGTSTVGNRNPHDTVSGIDDNDCQFGPGLFGSGNQISDGVIYGNTGGVIVDAANGVQIPDGYDGTATGTPSDYTNLTYDSENYDILFSETNSLGQYGKGIGTLPATVQVIVPPPPIQENSVPYGSANANSPLFNPRALVIFQDSREQPYDPDVPKVNRPYFSLENEEVARNGAMYFTTALEGNGTTGSALKSQYNPRDNTITYYYRDAVTNRWIISKTEFTPRKPDLFNYSGIVFGRNESVGKIFKWLPFRYRTLW